MTNNLYDLTNTDVQWNNNIIFHDQEPTKCQFKVFRIVRRIQILYVSFLTKKKN